METNTAETVTVKKIRKHRLLSHPILACFLLTLWGIFFYQGVGIFSAGMLGMIDQADVFAALCGAFLFPIHWLWFRPEFKGYINVPGMKDKQMWLIILVWLVGEIALLTSGYIEAGIVAPTIASIDTALMAGVSEEAVFRALGVSVMMRKYKDGGSIAPAVILPAVLFGLFHFINLSAGASLTATIGQVIFAAGTGVFFASIYLRSGSIVVTIFIHFLYDLAVMMQAGSESAITTEEVGLATILVQLIIALVECALAYWMLKGHTEEIQARWRTIWRTPVLASAPEEKTAAAE